MEDKEIKKLVEQIVGVNIDSNDKTEKEQIEEILNINLEEWYKWI